ncbi:MAG: collagenase [Colwellia sp.]|nr:collagenase [Colwellia sp.]
MKIPSLLLTGFVLSASIAVAQPQPQELPLKLPTKHFNDFSEITSHQHRLSPQKGYVPKPPRLVPPNEYQRMQAFMANKTMSTTAALPKTMLLSSNKSNMSLSNVVASANACASTDDLIGLTGSELVHALSGGDLYNCLYGLYDNKFAGSELFSDANLLTVVTAINDILVDYQGTTATGATELEKLLTYLRAMHWFESGTGRVFDATYQTALNQVFNRYFSAEHFVNFNGDSSRNFMVRFEMLILVNGSNTNRLPYLARFSEALLGYANSVSRTDDWGVYYQEQGFTNLLVHFFNANNSDETGLTTTLTNNPIIIDNLISFVSDDGLWLIDHTREYQWADTISELGRLLKFSGEIADKVRPSIINILNTYSYNGLGSSGWINAQEMVKFYDSENCDLYGDACQFNLQDTVLSGRHACSATVNIRFQGNISSENLTATCNTLNAGQVKFHQMFDTNPANPVADDFNSALEVVLFSSSADYESYAGNFFGIDTNNGGMYLEDTPSSESSQARFIAFQATWLTGFVIWNLDHEQYHYLDGRFNLWGNFADQPENSVWWSEGLSEYLSQPANYERALTEASLQTYQLSELFQTTYANSNQARTYQWGYLATRFMMENHRSEIDNILLPSMRAVKYNKSGGGASTEGCLFDWGWQAKPDAQDNGWLWLYDDSENGFNGSGYWVWTCGQPDTGEVPEEPPIVEFTPYQDIISNWGTNFDDEFNLWLVCIVTGEGYCEDEPQFRSGDLDQNGAIDKRDIRIFTRLLRSKADLGLEYDFNNDEQVNRRDVRALMQLCDLTRCAISPE